MQTNQEVKKVKKILYKEFKNFLQEQFKDLNCFTPQEQTVLNFLTLTGILNNKSFEDRERFFEQLEHTGRRSKYDRCIFYARLILYLLNMSGRTEIEDIEQFLTDLNKNKYPSLLIISNIDDDLEALAFNLYVRVKCDKTAIQNVIQYFFYTYLYGKGEKKLGREVERSIFFYNFMLLC